LPSFLFKPFLPYMSCESELLFLLNRYVAVMLKLAGLYKKDQDMNEFVEELASGDERLLSRLEQILLQLSGHKTLVYVDASTMQDMLRMDNILFQELLRSPVEAPFAFLKELASSDAEATPRKLVREGWISTEAVQPVFKAFLEKTSHSSYRLFLAKELLLGLAVLGEDLANLFERAEFEISISPADDNLVLAAQIQGVPANLETTLYDVVLTWIDWTHPLALVDRYCTVARETDFYEIIGTVGFLPQIEDQIMWYKAGMGADHTVVYCLEHTFHEDGPCFPKGFKAEAERAALEHNLPGHWQAFLRLPYPLLVRSDVETHLFYPIARRYLEMLALASKPDLQFLSLLGLFDRAMLLAAYIVASLSSETTGDISLVAYSPSQKNIFVTSYSCFRLLKDLVPGLLVQGMTAFYDLARPATHYRINRLCNLENDTGKLYPLHPLIVCRECPQCHEEELFAFLRLKGSKERPQAAEYVSLTTDHRLEAAELVEDLYVHGYI